MNKEFTKTLPSSIRDKQLLRLKDEVLDLEDLGESVTLNKFTLDDFRIELSKYIEANRKILEMYRLLCSGKTSPYEALCRLFDEQTDNGNNMKDYSALLGKAVNAIVSTYRKRVMHHLLSGRNAILPDQQSQVSEITDFELITWLVVK